MCQFFPETGQNIDDACWYVRGLQNLCKADRTQRHLFGCQDNTGVTTNDNRCNVGYQPEEPAIVRRQHRYDAGRLEYRKIEMGRADGIHRAENLLILVRPARVMNEPVYRCLDFFLCPAL